MLRFLSTAAAAFLSFCLTTTAMAGYYDDYYSGSSEEQIGQKAAADRTQFLERDYGLKHGFTDADLRTAAGVRAVKELRAEYNLAPDFTSDDLKRAAGNQYANNLLRQYPALPPHFTVQQLAEQRALEHITYMDGGFKTAFSFDDYARKTGSSTADDLAETHRLPQNYTYADLVSQLGPEDAAGIRADYGFSKLATHAEIVAAMGVKRARDFASSHELKEGFTAQDLFGHLVNFELAQIKADLGLDATATEEQLAESEGQRELALTVAECNGRDGKFRRLGIPFTDKDYASARADMVVTNIRLQYDLEPGFNEADIAAAASASAQAQERNYFHLRPGFTAEEDGAARKSGNNRWGNEAQ